MTDNIANLYISEVAELYNISDKNLEKMYSGADQINEALGKYYWDDVLHALQVFYRYHSDKSRPRLSQIVAILETDKDVKPREPEIVVTGYQLPKTHLWSINDTFTKFVDILCHAGVIPDADGNYTNNRTIIDPKTDLPVLNPMQWFKWQLHSAQMDRPEVFISIPTTTLLESLALAIQNQLITFRVRDWSKAVGGIK